VKFFNREEIRFIYPYQDYTEIDNTDYVMDIIKKDFNLSASNYFLYTPYSKAVLYKAIMFSSGVSGWIE